MNYNSETINNNLQFDLNKTDIKTEMKKINFPVTFEQIQNSENPEITEIFVKRVCMIHNKEAKLDENFQKIWKEFYEK